MSCWLLPCNPKYYDVDGVYKNLKTVDWKQTLSKVEIGDIAYIYVSAPVGGITYKCEVINVNKPVSTIDDSKFHIDSKVYADYGKYMELRFIEKYDNKELLYNALSLNGLKGRVQCQRNISGELEIYINNVTKK